MIRQSQWESNSHTTKQDARPSHKQQSRLPAPHLKNRSPTLHKFSPLARLPRNLQTSHLILDVKRGQFENIGKSFLLQETRHGKLEINLPLSLSFFPAFSRKRSARDPLPLERMPGCKHWCEWIILFCQERSLMASRKYEGEILSLSDPTFR